MLERENYIKDEIFVIRNKSEASSEMECPRQQKNGDGYANHSHRREDRKPHHRRSRHYYLRRERKWKTESDEREMEKNAKHKNGSALHTYYIASDFTSVVIIL